MERQSGSVKEREVQRQKERTPGRGSRESEAATKPWDGRRGKGTGQRRRREGSEVEEGRGQLKGRIEGRRGTSALKNQRGPWRRGGRPAQRSSGRLEGLAQPPRRPGGLWACICMGRSRAFLGTAWAPWVVSDEGRLVQIGTDWLRLAGPTSCQWQSPTPCRHRVSQISRHHACFNRPAARTRRLHPLCLRLHLHADSSTTARRCWPASSSWAQSANCVSSKNIHPGPQVVMCPIVSVQAFKRPAASPRGMRARTPLWILCQCRQSPVAEAWRSPRIMVWAPNALSSLDRAALRFCFGFCLCCLVM